MNKLVGAKGTGLRHETLMFIPLHIYIFTPSFKKKKRTVVQVTLSKIHNHYVAKPNFSGILHRFATLTLSKSLNILNVYSGHYNFT